MKLKVDGAGAGSHVNRASVEGLGLGTMAPEAADTALSEEIRWTQIAENRSPNRATIESPGPPTTCRKRALLSRGTTPRIGYLRSRQSTLSTRAYLFGRDLARLTCTDPRTFPFAAHS
jgi:hypothetical protein